MGKNILFFCLLLFSYSAVAQHRIVGGVRAGATTSQISGDDLSGFHKLGGYAGIFAALPFGEREQWKFQMELNMIMKGSSLYARGVNNPDFSKKYVLNLFYVEVPFLIRYAVFKNLDLEVGPTFNILFASREVTEAGKVVGRPFRFFEAALLGGISYTIKEKWAVSLRYTNSIVPVRLPRWIYDRLVKKQFNSTIALSATYQF